MIVKIKNNAWVTVNNDFCHSWGDSAMIFTRDFVTRENHCRIASFVAKIVIHGDECFILFLTRERGVLALWRHIRRLFLHAQIGAKAIFTSE